MPHLLLGIDLGSTGTKVSLLDSSSGAVTTVSAPSPLFSEHPGWAEADTRLWWENVCALVRAVAEVAGVSPQEIDGVATTGMVPAVVVLDAYGNVLRRAILQNDARAASEIDDLRDRLGGSGYDVLAETGSALTQQSVAPTWSWLVHNEPAVAKDATVLVGSYDWLAVALGADVHVELNWAIESGLYQLDGALAQPVLDAAGLPPALCAPIRRPGELVGVVHGRGRETSLREGTPIYVGGADHVLAAYAAGLSEPGDWLVKLGGAGDVLVVSDGPALDARWYLDAHPIPGLWLPNGCMATSGGLLRWAQQLFGGYPLAELDREAATAEPAALVCLPYFLGEKSPFHDPNLRGAIVGLHLGNTRGDVFRALMESVAYGFRQHLDIFSANGLVLGAGRVSNGGSKSPLWKQIVADVLGRPLLPVVHQGGAANGAAFVATVGSGVVDSFAEAKRYVEVGEPLVPVERNQAIYNEGYEIFLDLQGRLAPISHRLAERNPLTLEPSQ
ncbi:MAG: FGGY family carbohydrate kinase [Acidimicrobiales bacterium]